MTPTKKIDSNGKTKLEIVKNKIKKKKNITLR